MIVRKKDECASLLIYSKEGVTQGDPLAMVCYGVDTVPIIDKMANIRGTHQQWFADDAGVAGSLENIKIYFNKLCEEGTKMGYYPQEAKSVFVMGRGMIDGFGFSQDNEERTNEGSFKFVEGHRYLGGFIGDKDRRIDYVREKIMNWVKVIKLLSSLAKYHPQSVYHGVQKALLQELQFLQRVTDSEGSAYVILENTIVNDLLPKLIGTNPPDR